MKLLEYHHRNTDIIIFTLITLILVFTDTADLDEEDIYNEEDEEEDEEDQISAAQLLGHSQGQCYGVLV